MRAVTGEDGAVSLYYDVTKKLFESSSVLPKITVFEPEHKLESTHTRTHTHCLSLTEVLVTEHQGYEHTCS